MRPFRVMRNAVAAGSYLSLGCLFPIVILGVMWANLTILFEEMGWPVWIVWVALILLLIGFDSPFCWAYIVAIAIVHIGSVPAIAVAVIGISTAEA